MCMIAFSCEQADINIPTASDEIKPIRFTTQSEWPDITKAPVTGLGDLLNDGFIVWGAWAKDPDDQSYFIGDYSTGVNGSVFGTSGTLVSAVDGDENGVFAPNEGGSEDTWVYESERNWYRGYYSFAAILPASTVGNGVDDIVKSATLTSSFAKTGTGDEVQISYTNALTVTFPTNGLVLGGHNIVKDVEAPEADNKDLMFAFQTEDNSDNKSDNVSLNFSHAFAKLGINFLANDHKKIPFVTKVTLYGLYTSATALTLTQETTIENYRSDTENKSVETTFDVQGTISTEMEPFAVFTMPDGHFTEDDTPGDMTLVRKLVVLPQYLAAQGDNQSHPLYIKIDYRKEIEPESESNDPPRYTDETYSYTITLDHGTLEPGGNYVFSFLVDDIDFNEMNNNY